MTTHRSAFSGVVKDSAWNEHGDAPSQKNQGKVLGIKI